MHTLAQALPFTHLFWEVTGAIHPGQNLKTKYNNLWLTACCNQQPLLAFILSTTTITDTQKEKRTITNNTNPDMSITSYLDAAAGAGARRDFLNTKSLALILVVPSLAMLKFKTVS